MAINWKVKNEYRKQEQLKKEKHKEIGKGFPFLGLGIFFLLLLLSLLFLDYRLYKSNFKTASLFDMTNGKYREDTCYVDTCVGMFHDLIADTLYRDGYFFDTDQNESSLEIYNRVQKLRNTQGLYTYVNQGYDSYVKLNVRSYAPDKPAGKQMIGSLLPGAINITLYNIGNAYSGNEITSYSILENEDNDTTNSNKFGITFYDSGQQDFMVIGLFENFPIGVSYRDCLMKYGVINAGILQRYNNMGALDAVSGRNTFEFVELNKFSLKQDMDKKVDMRADYLYTVSDESGKYKAEINVSLNTEKTIEGKLLGEERDNTLDFREVWNSMFALAKFVPEKAPLLFLSYDDNIGAMLQGNQTYVKRYEELYGNESVENFDSDYERLMSSKRYINNKEVNSLYPHQERTVKSIFSKEHKIVALFADQKFHLKYVESPLYSYELAAVVLKYSVMLVPVLFLISVCFLVTGIYRKQQKNEQSVRILAMGFLPVEIRGVLLLILCLCLIYCYTVFDKRNLYSYISPFLLLVLMIFAASTICWWRMDKGSVLCNSWMIKLADRISEKRKTYYQTHGMSFFLGKHSNQFVCSEVILGVLTLIVFICKHVINGWFFILPLFGKNISVSVWTVVIIFLVVAIVFVFISYLRFLTVFEEGLNGVQRQLDLMGEGDFETIVPLPRNFYGFQVEEQFEAIKNGMLNAMEGEMRSERMKIDLVANVSHDIKTPLTSIINYVDLLADSKELPAVEADYVQVLQKKSYRLRSMIQDIFDLSKASSGNLSVEITELNFTKLIQQTMADMQERIEASELQFKCNLLEQVHIMSDGSRLYRVLQNLINNAINYSMERSRVYINLDVIDDCAVFSIKNMSRYELNFTREQVMERFFRGDQSRSSEGSGLGVAIANSFVEVCGGEFDISIDADLFCATIRIPVVMPLEKTSALQQYDVN